MADSGNRKVFFLHPQSVIQDDLVRALLEDNYEAYLIRNAVSAKAVVKEHPDAILLIQIDSGLEKEQWFSFADGLKANPNLRTLTIGVLSVQDMSKLEKKYLSSGSPFSRAFSYGSFDFDKSLAEITQFLVDEKARVPRNQIRGVAPESHVVSIAFTRDGKRYEGSLRDITIQGMTCRIGQETLLPSDIPIPAIIITFGRSQFTIAGRIAGSHNNEDLVHLILFDESGKNTKADDIYDLIQSCLQAQLQEVIDKNSHKRQVATKVPRSALYRRK